MKVYSLHNDIIKFFYSNRTPEAALMARSYLPSKVSEIVAIWKNDLNKVPSFLLFQVVIGDSIQWIPETACWFRKINIFVTLYLIHEFSLHRFNLPQFVFLIVIIIISLKVNPKAAESLADPEEYPNLFEDWQVALAVESNLAQKRCP